MGDFVIKLSFCWRKVHWLLLLWVLLPLSAQAEQDVSPALAVQQAINENRLVDAETLLANKAMSEFEQGYLQGWLSIKKGQEDLALEHWQKLRKRYPNSLELGNNLAVLLIKRQRYDEAQKILEQTLHADRQVSKALANLNQLYGYQAQKAYKKVFSKLDVEKPQAQWLALTETTNVEVVKAEFDAQQEVTFAIEQWRQAWSNQNFDGYLAAYGDAFVPADGQSFRAWRNARKRSVNSPKFIEVFVSGLKLTPISDTSVRATFNQRYRSDRYQDEVVKVLLLNKEAGHWKIVQEAITHEVK